MYNVYYEVDIIRADVIIKFVCNFSAKISMLLYFYYYQC